MKDGLKGLRTCRKCEVTYQKTEEFFNRAAGGRLRRLCKDCDGAIGTRRGTGKFGDALLPTSHPDYARDRWYRDKYGMTLETYEGILAEQGGTCGICGRPPKKYRLHVDHDHVTNEVRGLLCNHCNVTVGHIERYRDKIETWLS